VQLGLATQAELNRLYSVVQACRRHNPEKPRPRAGCFSIASLTEWIRERTREIAILCDCRRVGTSVCIALLALANTIPNQQCSVTRCTPTASWAVTVKPLAVNQLVGEG